MRQIVADVMIVAAKVDQGVDVMVGKDVVFTFKLESAGRIEDPAEGRRQMIAGTSWILPHEFAYRPLQSATKREILLLRGIIELVVSCDSLVHRVLRGLRMQAIEPAKECDLRVGKLTMLHRNGVDLCS